MNSNVDKVITQVIRILHSGRKDSAASLNQRQDMHGYFCPNPFSQLDISESGKAFSCCSAWLPKSIGNLKDEAVSAVWNSSSSQEIRKSILDGSYKYCDPKICPRIQAKSLPTIEEAKETPRYRDIIENKRYALDELPTFINLCNDASCNLYCPSCRKKRILHTSGKALEQRKSLQQLIESQLFSQPTDRDFTVNITGSGDPFASTVFRNFLFTLNGSDFPNLKIHLQTNGVLLTPSNWKKMHRIHQNISVVLISFDAATESTYQITRSGGHWPTLLSNTARLGEFRKAGELQYLRLDFVVQDHNFTEMKEFVTLAKNLGADKAAFSMVLDWGTWSRADYKARCIWKTDHPRFAEFLAVLQDPVFDEKFVDLGNLTEYRNRAVASGAAA